MVKKNIAICDVCNRSISDKKCDCCKKDVCPDCYETEDMGTIGVVLCKDCERKIDTLLETDESFWDEFNKQLDLKNKMIEYIGKKLILSKLDDEKIEEEDDDTPSCFAEAVRRGGSGGDRHRSIASSRLRRRKIIGDTCD